MNKILISIIAVFMMSNAVVADDTTCANGAGVVITGAVTEHKYCKSNQKMNWWNAMAWCDGQDRRLFDISDCACSDITADCSKNKCPELNDVYSAQWVWTARPRGETGAHYADIKYGAFTGDTSTQLVRSSSQYALCY